MHQRDTHTQSPTLRPIHAHQMSYVVVNYTHTHSQKEQMRREAGLGAWWMEEGEGKWFTGEKRGELEGRQGRGQVDETEGMAGKEGC